MGDQSIAVTREVLFRPAYTLFFLPFPIADYSLDSGFDSPYTGNLVIRCRGGARLQATGLKVFPDRNKLLALCFQTSSLFVPV